MNNDNAQAMWEKERKPRNPSKIYNQKGKENEKDLVTFVASITVFALKNLLNIFPY